MNSLRTLMGSAIVHLADNLRKTHTVGVDGFVLDACNEDMTKTAVIAAKLSYPKNIASLEVRIVDRQPKDFVQPEVLAEFARFAPRKHRLYIAAAQRREPADPDKTSLPSDQFLYKLYSRMFGYRTRLHLPLSHDGEKSCMIELVDRGEIGAPEIFKELSALLGYCDGKCYELGFNIGRRLPIQEISMVYKWLMQQGYNVDVCLTNATSSYSSAKFSCVVRNGTPDSTQFVFYRRPSMPCDLNAANNIVDTMEEIVNVYDPKLIPSLTHVSLDGTARVPGLPHLQN